MNKPLQKYLRTRTLVFPIAIPCIPTMVPRIPIIPLIPRISTMIPHIPTLILRIPTLIPCIPTLIPRIPIILLIPFPDSPFRLLQIASYLDINHFSNKIDHLREICSKSPIDILCLDETNYILTQMLNLKSQVIYTCHIVKTETKMETAK